MKQPCRIFFKGINQKKEIHIPFNFDVTVPVDPVGLEEKIISM
ncbi:MAG TPA: hypothetical protein VMW42_13920 [Desulfatiglandales bacterium]|nr:hypothetical protein [Desulfatiglandales bacterium]